jgi:hypothetical protein
LIPMPTRALPSTHWLELFASNAGEAIARGRNLGRKSANSRTSPPLGDLFVRPNGPQVG